MASDKEYRIRAVRSNDLFIFRLKRNAAETYCYPLGGHTICKNQYKRFRTGEQSQKFEDEKLQASKPNSNEEKRNSLRNSELPKPFPYRMN